MININQGAQYVNKKMYKKRVIPPSGEMTLGYAFLNHPALRLDNSGANSVASGGEVVQ